MTQFSMMWVTMFPNDTNETVQSIQLFLSVSCFCLSVFDFFLLVFWSTGVPHNSLPKLLAWVYALSPDFHFPMSMQVARSSFRHDRRQIHFHQIFEFNSMSFWECILKIQAVIWSGLKFHNPSHHILYKVPNKVT